jgi:hypothetical protein
MTIREAQEHLARVARGESVCTRRTIDEFRQEAAAVAAHLHRRGCRVKKIVERDGLGRIKSIVEEVISDRQPSTQEASLAVRVLADDNKRLALEVQASRCAARRLERETRERSERTQDDGTA